MPPWIADCITLNCKYALRERLDDSDTWHILALRVSTATKSYGNTISFVSPLEDVAASEYCHSISFRVTNSSIWNHARGFRSSHSTWLDMAKSQCKTSEKNDSYSVVLFLRNIGLLVSSLSSDKYGGCLGNVIVQPKDLRYHVAQDYDNGTDRTTSLMVLHGEVMAGTRNLLSLILCLSTAGRWEIALL